ncbi:MAG: hypothetical protein H6581_22845 [Bacteroidia bacterium]|nr:hypothetical protein [Bacteroidia bacterium]
MSAQENEYILIPIVFGIVMLLGFGVAFVAFMLAFQRKKFAHFREKERLKLNFQQEILRANFEIQEATQTMIGRELHDSVGQTLAVSRLYLASIQDAVTGEALQKAIQAEELVRKAMQDIRAVSHSLNVSRIQETGFETALKELATQISKSGKIKCSLTSEGARFRLESGHEIILYRICQELINNALRHSGGDEIKIGLRWQPGQLHLEISDNGQGFACDPLPAGHGLADIQLRARLIGTDFRLNSSPEGTRATLIYKIN